MADITYEDVIAARTANRETTGDFDIMGMANLALKILEQTQLLKSGAGNQVMQSRTPEQATAAGAAVSKPTLDVDSILEALKTVKSLKGDLKITELETLLKENKDQVSMLLGKMG